MFEKVIEFSCNSLYFDLKEDYPEPIKLNIPEWFKKLNHSIENQTIKGCMPFLDTLTIGYVLKLPQDLYINHNIENSQNEKDSFFKFGLSNQGHLLNDVSLNLNSLSETHDKKQLAGSPLVEKNKNLNFYKILNPWTIKTPKGYSCLLIPPLNNADDRFHIISGIVDTDVFSAEINFPIVINGDKYPQLKTILKKGTPYVQIIPFKRDNWKLKLSSKKQIDILKEKIKYDLTIYEKYKKKFWKKKSCT
jgi:hypothetical protein